MIDSEISTTYLILGTLFFIGIFVREIFRANKQRLAFRLIAISCMVLGIVGILVQPNYSVDIPSKKAIVTTEGYDAAFLDSLKQQNPEVDVIPLSEFTSRAYQEIFLVGNGVAPYELERFEQVKTLFYPSVLPFGITDVVYNARPIQYKEILVKGRSVGLENNKVVLEGPQGRIDSLTNATQFEFIVTPKIAGQQMYYLEYWNDTLLMERNPLPLDVQMPNQLNVLLLNSSPSFESNHLKQFLAANNHVVAVRNRISKNRYSNEFVNTNRMKLGNLDKNLLSAFDLLIIDQKEFASLTVYEIENMEEAIQKGMGLLLHSIYSDSFSKGIFTDFTVVKKKSQKIAFPPFESAVVDKNEFDLVTTKNVFPLLEINKITLSAYQLLGRGKVGVIVADDTYRLNIRGKKSAYAYFWSKQIDELVANNYTATEVKIIPKIPIEKQPLGVNVIDVNTHSPNVAINKVEVSMAQSIPLKEHWNGEYWPDQKGWHQLMADSTRYYFYVHEKEDWKALKAKEKRENNKRYFLNSKNTSYAEQKEFKAIPLYIAFLLFLLGASYLWLEAKL